MIAIFFNIQDDFQRFIDFLAQFHIIRLGFHDQKLENVHEEGLEILTGVLHKVNEDVENGVTQWFVHAIFHFEEEGLNIVLWEMGRQLVDAVEEILIFDGVFFEVKDLGENDVEVIFV